jgi:hypothetical protein
MSAVEISNVAVASQATLEKKPRAPRKPTLPAKYQKFMTFGFTMLRSLQETGALSEEALETSYTAQLKLFGALDDQTAFYQAFLDGCSAQTKVMKKFVADRNKPPRKPRAKKEVDPDAPKKERKPRAKKEVTVVSDAADNVIAELTSAALAPIENTPIVPKEKKPRGAPKKTKTSDSTVLPIADAIPEPIATTTAPESESESKPKTTKTTKTKAAKSEPKTKAAKSEPKTKTSKAKKDVAPDASANNDDDDDDDDVILTRETIIDGKPFLIDQHNNLYDPISHDFLRQI